MSRRTSSISRQPTAIDENTPPASSGTAAPRKPSALRQPTALGNNGASNAGAGSRSSPRLRDKDVKAAAKARAIAIQVQLPTSDGAIEAGMPPTPPCSQSPPADERAAASSRTISRPGSSQSLLPPAPIRSGNLRNSRSPSAIPTSISSAPLHAPQVIAARRRSSASPAAVPSPVKPSARRKTLTSIPAPAKSKTRNPPAASNSTVTAKPKARASSSTANRRRSSIKRLPTPTETLKAPLSPGAGDSDGEDPLLLKSAAEMRGWGEGRPSLGGKLRRTSRGRSESTAREMSFAFEHEEEPSMLMQQKEPVQVQVDSDFQWRDEDLLPLGSGTIEEDLPSDYEARLPATQEEDEEEVEEIDYGGYDGPFAGDNDYGDATSFDFAPLQEQDSDVESVADEPTLVEGPMDEPTLVEVAVQEAESEAGEEDQQVDEEEEEVDEPIPAQLDTPRRHSHLRRPHLDYALPTDLDASYELEYEVPIQPESSSPVRAPIPSSPRSLAYTRPSPFLSSVGRPSPSISRPSPFLSDNGHAAETSPSRDVVQLPAESEEKAFVEHDEVDEEQEAQEEELALEDESFESQGELELKVEDEEHSASLSRSPSPAPAPAPKPVEAAEERPLPAVPRESWSRGPAFFRSSPSVSMSPVLSYPSLTATSPDMSSRRGGAQELGDETEEEEEEDEIVLAGEETRARSSSVAVEDSLFLHRSVSGSAPRSRAASYASSIGRQSAQGDESDASMSSPHRPLSIAEVSMASPRCPLSDASAAADVQMSSPSPQRRSPASHHSPQLPQHSPSLHRKLPATPPVEALAEEEVDAQMASPSPVRRTAPPSAERMMSGGIVQMGRQTLQGLFGASPVTRESKGKGREENADGDQNGAEEIRSSTAFVVEAVRASTTITTQSAPTPKPTGLAAAPATIAPLARVVNAHSSNFTPVPRPLNLPSTTHGKPSQSTISRSALRRRPSHPTLPVVEISSTDPKAAARAAAILKVYHDYVEQGLEAPGSLLEEAGIRRSAIKGGKKADVASARKGQRVEEGVSVAESELRELLEEAEEEVREGVERRSVSVPAEPSTASRSSGKQGRQTDTPTTSRLAMDGSSSRLASPLRTSAAIVENREWTSAEWRRLELALVEEGRVTRQKHTELVVEKVLRRFLNGEGLNREQCVGQWAWDKLVIRVTALQKRRYQDSLRRSSSRASSRAPSLSSSVAPIPGALPRRRRRSLHEELREAEASPNADASSNADTERAPSPIIKVEQFSDDEAELSGSLVATASPEESDEEDSDSEPDRDVEDDTFFERPRPAALAPPAAAEIRRSPSVDPITGAIRPPPALAGSRFAHLYDEPVEKPRLPSQSWVPPASEELEEGDTTAEIEEGSSYEHSEGTPEPGRQPSEAPSSARKLFSYLGNLVRRPSATPEPQREMKEVAFARTQQPFPSASQRKISPLPPSRSAPSTSTSTPTVAITPAPPRPSSTAYPATAPAAERRRRSSGEGKVWSQIAALEDAESSREEDARVIELLQSGGAAKRRASGGDLRGASMKAAPVYGSPAVFVPAGTRALDRPIGEKKAGRGW